MPRFALRSNRRPMLIKEPHDRSFARRQDREAVALAGRGAAAGAISPGLADAGHSSGHETRRRHDIPYLLWNPHAAAHRSQVRLAVDASCGAGAFASALVLATTVTGWIFASFRGWGVSFFYLVPLPMLASENAAAGKAFDGWHQA